MEEILELSDNEVLAGSHINDACEKAVALAGKRNKPVHFKFNDVDVMVQPGELPADVIARWDADREAAHQAWINSDEYKQQEARREAEAKTERERVMIETASTEKEMCEAKVPWPRTEKQLLEYIKSLVEREHDYGTCVYAMSMAAEAAFNYVSHCLGVTGFQASCADMDFLRRTRSIKGPWMIIKGEDALYPQYDLHAKVNEMLEESGPWLKEQATAKLVENLTAHPDVIKHWKRLAGGYCSDCGQRLENGEATICDDCIPF